VPSHQHSIVWSMLSISNYVSGGQVFRSEVRFA
jgi:hypothetical protein